MLPLINSNVGLKSTVINHVMAYFILYDYYPFHRWIGAYHNKCLVKRNFMG